MLRKPKRAAVLAAGLFIALTGLTLAFEAPTDDSVLNSGKDEHGVPTPSTARPKVTSTSTTTASISSRSSS